jgi:YcxB-like protein
MLIRTHEFRMTEQEYFKVTAYNFLRQRWWLMALLVGAAALHALRGGVSVMSVLTIGLVVLYPVYVAAYLWYYANSKQNRLFFEERFIEIDGEFVTGRLNDGSVAKTKWDHIVKVIRTSSSYLLYLSKSQFIYIPVDAFDTEDDLELFETFVKNRKWAA